MKKLIFCDIDGTILDGSRGMNEVSEKTRYAIDELKKDNYVVIASGRCKGLLDENILSLKPSGFVLCNGAYAEIEGKAIHEMYFDDEATEKLREVTRKYDGCCINETLDQVYVDSLDSKAFLAFIESWGKALQGFKVEDLHDPQRYMISMIAFTDREALKKAQDELRGYVECLDHKGFSSCDINIIGVNKATGVQKIIEYLGIPLEDTYCFGDAVNDLEMLQCVGHPVIMANCMEELRGRGFEETGDVLEDGFYEYLRENKLIKGF